MVVIVSRTEMFATVMAFVQIFGVLAASIAVRHEETTRLNDVLGGIKAESFG
jgi:hypothetical protein